MKQTLHPTFSIWLAFLFLLATSARTMAQANPDTSTFLPLVEGQPSADNRSAATPVAYTDSAVTLGNKATVAPVIPFSLRAAAEVSAAASAVDIQLPLLDVAGLRQEDQARSQGEHAVRIGVVRELPDLVSAANATQSSGHWYTTSDGGHFWTLTIESPEAKAIRVHLENLTIPAGGHVMVYNTQNPAERYGPYRQADLFGAADLWTASVYGSVVTLEYYVPPAVDPAASANFRISEISHVYVDVSTLLSPQEGACHNDVTCSANWVPDANGVAGLGTIGGSAGALWCSGSLLNDLDAETAAGYFLTANHCLSGNSTALGTQAQANTVEFYWLYQTPTCNGVVPNPATVPRTAGGADLISNQTKASGNDHAFLRIRNALPGGLTLAGWDTTAFSNSDDVIGIHHPDGAFKRISFGDISNSDTNFWKVIWTDGVTEPGSSGSPIFDTAHRIRGQLRGGASACDTPSGEDEYGRFNVTYPAIERWLLIGGTIRVDRNYGGAEQGTPAQPYRTIGGANGFAWNGVHIRIKPGVYDENVVINRNVVLIADGGPVVIGRP